MGLTFLQVNSITRVLFWAQDAVQTALKFLDVNFDPSVIPAEYTLRLTPRRESGDQLWTVDALVNNEELVCIL